jgi:protein phosphatase
MPGKMDYFGITDVGRERPANEDQFMIADLTKSLTVHQSSLGVDDHSRLFGSSQGKLLVVADGMGGHAAGERASTVAVSALSVYALNTLRWYFRLNEQDEEEFEADLKEALQRCQAAIMSETEAQPQRFGMGTTLTMAYVIWPRLYVVHAGDSRCYLFHGGKLQQITRDHSMGQLYRETIETPTTNGPAESEEGKASHMLWNVLGGTDERLDPEVYRARLDFGDSLVLCTDGLTRHVPNERIAKLLGTEGTAKQVSRQLVEEANAGGGSDNITVIVARFRESSHEFLSARQAEILDEAIQHTEPLSDTKTLDEVKQEIAESSTEGVTESTYQVRGILVAQSLPRR